MDQETAEFLKRIVSIVTRTHALCVAGTGIYADDQLANDIADLERDIAACAGDDSAHP